jgi:hypothetical protein
MMRSNTFAPQEITYLSNVLEELQRRLRTASSHQSQGDTTGKDLKYCVFHKLVLITNLMHNSFIL